MKDRVDVDRMMEDLREENQAKMIAAYRDSAEMDLRENISKDHALMRDLLIDAIAGMSVPEFEDALLYLNRDSQIFGTCIESALENEIETYISRDENQDWIEDRAIELAMDDGWRVSDGRDI